MSTTPALVACGSNSDSTGTTASTSGSSGANGATTQASSTATNASTESLGAVGSLSSNKAHSIEMAIDPDEFSAMVSTYSSSGEKEWIAADVTIDGTTYADSAIRLKGNSTLRGVSTDDDPATLPWLVKLDKTVEQDHDGLTEFVIRGSSSKTSLNEAVALELLSAAGLASQDAAAISLSVNGSEPVLRLVIDNPEDEWMSEVLSDSGALYKAEAEGDYSYRGSDSSAYEEAFDQEAGKDNADLTPLVEFLDFINNSDDATFAAELDDHLDVDAFATYLAVETLIDNFDDIDGPGNNSYLYYDTETGRFTIVPWDHNLAFGMRPGGAGGGPGGMPPGDMPQGGMPPGGGALPSGVELPAGGMPAGPGGGGPGGKSNALATRFQANDDFAALYEAKLASLKAELYTSGLAADVLDTWTNIVSSIGLVEESTVTSESAAIAEYFT